MKEIPLTQGKTAIVDDADYDLVMAWKWHVGKTFGGGFRAQAHDRSTGKDRSVFMHRVVLGLTDSRVKCDHIDHDGLNNQRFNLRTATTQQNSANMRPKSGCASKFKGVTWDRTRRLWLARIKVSYVGVNLGRYQNEEDAARAYDKAALDSFGEFACLNFPVTVGFDINPYGAQTVRMAQPMTIRDMLLEFNEKMGKQELSEPGWPSDKKIALALRLVLEECSELQTAIETHDLVETADALADIAYVVESAFQAFGINSEPVIAEVHRTNMLKADGPRRADGKVLKPAGWQPPRIYEILDAQCE